MSGDVQPAQPALPSEPVGMPRIAGPTPCVKCLYDLGGLMSDQRCPECGISVTQTLGSLALANVDALTRLCGALLHIGLAMAGGPVIIIAATYGAAATASLGVGRGEMAPFLVLMIAATGPVLSSIGWRRFEVARAATALDPWASPGPKTVEQSNLLRGLALVFALMFIAAPVGVLIVVSAGEEWMVVPAVGYFGAMYICWAVRTYIGLGALGELRRRLKGDAGLRIVGTFRALTIVVTCTAVATFGLMVLGRSGTLWLIILLYLSLLCTGVVTVICGIWVLLLRRRTVHFLKAATVRMPAARLAGDQDATHE
jgi:hypothetical protein